MGCSRLRQWRAVPRTRRGSAVWRRPRRLRRAAARPGEPRHRAQRVPACYVLSALSLARAVHSIAQMSTCPRV
eukprot:scaffold35020_cov61-Phaeocystis_antarctica.AAC.7